MHTKILIIPSNFNFIVMAFTLVLLFTTLVFARPVDTDTPKALNITQSDLPPAIWSVCEGGVNATTVSSQFLVGDVVLSKGYCTPQLQSANETVPGQALRSISATAAATTRARMARQSCPTAQNDCVRRFGSSQQGRGYVNKCGATCRSSCYPGSNGPNPNDCQHIFDSFNSNNPQLFTIQPNQYLLATYRSCGTAIQNQIAASPVGCSQWMVYDYQDWAAVGNYLAWNCQAQQGARGGRCTGTTGIYQPSVPDFYIQVYQN